MLDVIVIGGGPAGMMTAITAANNGLKVMIIEKNKRVGKKLLVTGNGRCNLSNNHMSAEHYHGNGDVTLIYQQVIDQFGLEDTCSFFERIGIAVVEGGKGKLYPRSLQASSVVEALLMETERLGVEIKTKTYVDKLIKKDGAFKVYTQNDCFIAKSVVLAVGGKASPDLGSDGKSYDLAEYFGHKLTDILPGIIQLKSDFPYNKSIKGTKVDANVRLTGDGEEICTSQGEVLFTDYGLSGPAILDVSSYAVRGLKTYNSIDVTLDIVPDIEGLATYMVRRLDFAYKKDVQAFLIGLVNKRLIIPILKLAEIDIHKKACELSKVERKRLISTLKYMPFHITGTNQWNQAQVTVGGIDLRDIDMNTMESKQCNGLYIVGEMMDIDGDCGGYNLQWAWSTGYIAGSSCGGN